jgi:hypothetical protein
MPGHDFQFGDNFRAEGLKATGKQVPKLDANNIAGNMSTIQQGVQGLVTDFIKKHDPKNSSGAKQNQLDILDKLLKKGKQSLASLKGMIGDANMNSVASDNNSDQNQNNICPPGQRFDQIQQKCVIDCPPGQVWDMSANTCVDDTYNQVANIDPATGMPVSIIQ